MKLQTAFQIPRLVLVDDVDLGEFVEHRADFREQSLGSGFVCRIAQGLHRVAGGLVVIAVTQTTNLRLANSFQ